MLRPAKDIERRRPVWDAMTDFFLDTELTAANHSRIASILAASGYSVAELEWILWRELCPVLWMNLASVAGEWAGFNMEYVEKKILSQPAGRMWSWWCYVNGGCLARHDWAHVRKLLTSLRLA